MTQIERLRAACGFLLDMDGVIYEGDHVLPGASELVEYLQQREISFLFVTNNAASTPAMYVERLAQMGMQVTEELVYTSALATAEYLARQKPDARVLMIGEEGLRVALDAVGLRRTDDYREADYVVVGLDRQLTYARMKSAALAINRGAQFIATNPDTSLPSPEGPVPGNGAALAYLEVATRVKPLVIGKPEPGIFQQALERLELAAAGVYMIGDRYETDILGAQRTGIATIAVLTGISSADEFAQANPAPDYVFQDLTEFLQALRGS